LMLTIIPSGSKFSTTTNKVVLLESLYAIFN
jgi:hypothetical protein